ncbi:hypothetical protein [Fusobacterium russii]|uniref:hypothetical protein n=1 Tax=Fusobacterium russii TaxID=854 RepID=UPI0003A3CDDD|nr:hypothetical protein [Fusobacterium russii]
MRTSSYFLLFLIFLSSTTFSSNLDIDNIIEIQLIAGTASKTYYTFFSTSDNSFIFYDSLY